MSSPRPDLSIKKEDIAEYVKYLAGFSSLIQVRLWGSRSPIHPLHERRFKPNVSDWDLLIIWEEKVFMPSPRLRTKGIHADVVSLSQEQYDCFKEKDNKSVQLYPKDEYNLLS